MKQKGASRFSRNRNSVSTPELELVDTEIKRIAREELNSFLESQGRPSLQRKSVLEEHLRNNDMIAGLSRLNRDKRNKIEHLRTLCRDQISTAKKRAKAIKYAFPKSPLPMHEGYNRLIKLLEDNEEYPSLLELCIEAKEQGWKGNWDEEIKRVKRKMKESYETH